MWKIVGVSETLVLYIYIYIDNLKLVPLPYNSILR